MCRTGKRTNNNSGHYYSRNRLQKNGWTTKSDIREIVKDMLKIEFGQYLLRITED